MPGVDSPSIKAVLGPTNTGKTYLAIERMLGHESGMMGFPLRLLARENYDRVVRLRGASSVALITGEERIVPPRPRYFLCTAEAMPLDRRVAFLGIDEVQLCGDPERGHIFTHRLLHARGTEETMFLGAETIAPLIRQLVPEAEFERRERFSKLSYAGYKKLTRLPPRSAVIAFSAAQVYALAELLRRQRGGTAVVLGALSPRTRNAQVAMYEAGEVDYLVATDAIGMGLNMAIDHVAFSSLAKFDGHGVRRLHANEIGQIAGRAGRHMADGTFGPTAELDPFEPELVRALEEHQFENLRRLNWRSADLDFVSLDALKRSLEAPPPSHLLKRARAADDYNALVAMIADPAICDMATTPDQVRLMWDICQVPDFGRDLHDGHRRLVARLYRFLAGGGTIPEEFVARAVGRLDRIDGDIDTLVGRIANVRTWTYVSHRGEWLDDADGWQERARALEDKLSDALHERLTQRFVDRKT
ncbi:MAG: helicase-related protein, partial [Alphaproteobacteria bacterium]